MSQRRLGPKSLRPWTWPDPARCRRRVGLLSVGWGGEDRGERPGCGPVKRPGPSWACELSWVAAGGARRRTSASRRLWNEEVLPPRPRAPPPGGRYEGWRGRGLPSSPTPPSVRPCFLGLDHRPVRREGSCNWLGPARSFPWIPSPWGQRDPLGSAQAPGSPLSAPWLVLGVRCD